MMKWWAKNHLRQDTFDSRDADQYNGPSHDIWRVLVLEEGIYGVHYAEKLKIIDKQVNC